MEYYYLDKNNKQVGPLSIDQLKSIGLKPDTLVWREGFPGWKRVKDVDEIKNNVTKPLPSDSWSPNAHKTNPSAPAPTATSSDVNYERNKLYFFPKSVGTGWMPFALIGFSIILFIIQSNTGGYSGRDTSQAISVFPWLLMIFGVFWIIIVYVMNIEVTDEEYDSAVYNKFKSIDITQTALEKIGLDEDQVNEIQPVSFHGYRVDKEAAEKTGKDGKLRTSKYDATVLFFSDSQVFMYQQIFDMIDGTKLEYTLEYFYKDIVSFSTSTKTSEKNKNAKGISTFTLIVPNDEFYCSMGNISDADAVIGAVKQKLREKRG